MDRNLTVISKKIDKKGGIKRDQNLSEKFQSYVFRDFIGFERLKSKIYHDFSTLESIS